MANPQDVTENTRSVAELESQLNDFDLLVRAAALRCLVTMAREGTVPLRPARPVVNMHCHTFYSFNAYGHSPSSLAWLARREGYRAVGIVDFDVLDAVDEFLSACDVTSVRGTAGIESRVFLPEYATRELTSPGEPGVSYHMGVGFTTGQAPQSAQGILADMRQRARARNLGVMTRVNAYLDPVTIDYERDVLPLTPNGNATERHMLVAYVRAAERAVLDPALFWAQKLNVEPDRMRLMLRDFPTLANLIRSKLMKRGGVGYVQPGPDSFPTVDEYHRFITACGALPCMTWLDGTSEGEAAARELLEFWLARGVVAMNIVPDRNWNIADPEMRRVKIQKLYEVVALAEEYGLPLNVGTEMNAYGNKLVDDFDAPELLPVRQAFIDGAHFVYGHTVLQRALGMGYLSSWAESNFPTRRSRNDFYTQVGALAAPAPGLLTGLRTLPQAPAPELVLNTLER